jgi:hypothetical protein
MSESITCPICKRTSYHPDDVANKYCGACSCFHGEIGRELKASELEPRTVVVLLKEGRRTAATMWVLECRRNAVIFLAAEVKTGLMLYRDGDELRDDTAPMRVFQYLGGEEPTSGGK